MRSQSGPTFATPKLGPPAARICGWRLHFLGSLLLLHSRGLTQYSWESTSQCCGSFVPGVQGAWLPTEQKVGAEQGRSRHLPVAKLAWGARAQSQVPLGSPSLRVGSDSGREERGLVETASAPALPLRLAPCVR